jgi:hypothetical protein
MDMPRKAKPLGRRRKTDAARRETLIKVLVTSDERDRYQAAADQMGVSLSTWMRLTAGAAISLGGHPKPATDGHLKTGHQ